MQYVTADYEIIEGIKEETDVYKHLESVARTCYQSFDYTKEDSYKRLLTMLLKHGHEAMIEHVNFILKLSDPLFDRLKLILSGKDHFLRFTHMESGPLVSGNPRAFRDLYRRVFGIGDLGKFFDCSTEHEDEIKQITMALVFMLNSHYSLLFQDLVNDNKDLNHYEKISKEIPEKFSKGIQLILNTQSLSPKEKIVHHYVSIRFKNVPRGFTHEIVRMRGARQMWDEDYTNDDFLRYISFGQESTRYCDYTKQKFGNGLKVVQTPVELTKKQEKLFKKAYKCAEKYYAELREIGVKAQIARDVLPIGVKSEIVVTTNLEEWYHILKLRTHPTSHPIMHIVMRPLLIDFQERFPDIFADLENYS